MAPVKREIEYHGVASRLHSTPWSVSDEPASYLVLKQRCMLWIPDWRVASQAATVLPLMLKGRNENRNKRDFWVCIFRSGIRLDSGLNSLPSVLKCCP